MLGLAAYFDPHVQCERSENRCEIFFKGYSLLIKSLHSTPLKLVVFCTIYVDTLSHTNLK
jgi:hypothetical protein